LLDNQTVARGATTLLNLSYDYANTASKRTGQLTKILNNLNHNKDRGYSYDALGRLTQATGGPATGAPLWTQTYTYDRYGNRTSVSASGYSASLRQRGSSPTVKEGSTDIARANAGSANILPAMSTQREAGASEPEAVATGKSDPQVVPPTEQLVAGTDLELSDSQRSTPGTNSHHASRLHGSVPSGSRPTLIAGKMPALPARTNAATPQGGPPVFTDDPLLAGVTLIKTVHITELRTAVNQARSRAALPPANWAESVSSGVLIKAAHIVELRLRLDEARAALSMSPASYTDPTLTVGVTAVKAVHIQQLRQYVTEAITTNFAIPVDGHANLSYDTATNRITTAGFAYDAAGNQVRALIPGSSNSQRFQYDAANRLVNVKSDNNQTIIASYTYGDSNERLILEEAGVRTYYACDGSVEYTESGGSTTPQWSKTYIYFGARLLSTLTPNGSGGEFVQYHHPDRLGTRLVTNAQDTNSFEQVTLPFGTALSAESTGATNRRFTTYDRSVNTGLDYALNRHYDPQQGRFTQVDPAGMKATSVLNPQTLNLYAYCTNDPINHADPNGLGFFSFLKKAFNWIKSHWKIILVAVVVAVAVLLIPGAPAFLWSSFQQGGSIIFSGGVVVEGAGGISTTLKIILGASIAAGIAGLGTLLQQRASQRTSDVKSILRKKLKHLLKKKQCKNFLDGLLKQLAKDTGNPTVASTFLQVFEAASFRNISSEDLGNAFVTASGAILGINFSRARPGGRESLEAITIHETAHGATRVFQGYSEFQIASAAFTVGRAMGLVPDLVPPPNPNNDNYSNLLFDQTVIAACGPYPNK
jgi:RHS repeat-associated protein